MAIRTAQFREAARPGAGVPGGRLRALALLQQRLGAVVDHSDEKEERQVGTTGRVNLVVKYFGRIDLHLVYSTILLWP